MRTTEGGPWLNYDPPAHGTIETTSESSIGSIRLACGGAFTIAIEDQLSASIAGAIFSVIVAHK